MNSKNVREMQDNYFCPHCGYVEEVGIIDDQMEIRCARCDSSLKITIYTNNLNADLWVQTKLLQPRGFVIQINPNKGEIESKRLALASILGCDGKPITVSSGNQKPLGIKEGQLSEQMEAQVKKSLETHEAHIMGQWVEWEEMNEE